ncbi:MAG: Ig-like domain-containing protein [Gemmatimonadota bacterium]
MSLSLRAILRSGIARVAAVAVILLTSACTERGNQPFAPDAPKAGRVRFAVVPQFNYLGGQHSAGAPINRIRLTAREVGTGTVLGQTIRDVAATDSTWNVAVDVTVADGIDVVVVVLVELINVTAGVETVEWSGLTAPITVSPGETEEPTAAVQLFQGPPENLQVTGVVVNPQTTTVSEGDSVSLTAIVSPSGTVIWSSLDPAIATVSATGRVITLLPGTARIVAIAGPRADTAVITINPRIASIRVTPDSIRLTAFGQEVTFTAQALDARGAAIPGAPVNWTIDDIAVAEHLGAGRFRGKANGRTLVRATSVQNPARSATAILSVAQRASQITLDPPVATLTAIGATLGYVATARDAAGNPVSGIITWRSTNLQVATVNASGIATATGLGTTQIRAVLGAGTPDSVVATASLTVVQSVRSITITPGSLHFGAIGDGAALSAVGYDANGNPINNAQFTWVSENPGVATVDGNGFVRAIASGTTNVRAEADGVSASTAITVQPNADVLVISPDTIRLPNVGDTARFSAVARDQNGFIVTNPAFVWTSLDANVATVNSTSGQVTAVGGGTARIVVSLNARADTGIVIVTAARPNLRLTSLTVTPASLMEGDTAIVQGVIDNTGPVAVGPFAVRLRAIDSALGSFVAGADSTVFVPGLGAGAGLPFTVRVFIGPAVTWPDSVRTQVDVDAQAQIAESNEADNTLTSNSTRIQFPVATVVATPDSAQLRAVGDTVRFGATARDRHGRLLTGRLFTWVSTDTAIIRVDASGLVTGRAFGRAAVIVTAESRADTMPVTVVQTLGSLVITPQADTVGLFGDTVRLTAVVRDASGAVIQTQPFWMSLDSAAVVDQTGLVFGIQPGIARIVATSGPVADTALITVMQTITNYDVQPDSLVLLLGDSSVVFATTIDANQAQFPVYSTWSGSDTTVAAFRSMGFGAMVYARSIGVAYIRGSANSFTDSVKIIVVPATARRDWTGAVSFDWHDPNNWSPVGVPTATDTARIPLAANQPVLNANATIAKLQSVQGTNIDINTYDLSVGQLFTDGIIVGAGRLVLTGGFVAGGTQAAVPNVLVSGNTVFGSSLTVNGDLLVGSGAFMTMAGVTIRVTRDFTSGGTLQMTLPQDSLLIFRNASFDGGDTNGFLTDGVMTVVGNFTAATTAQAFSASGNHRVVLNGNALQTVSFSTPDSIPSGQHFHFLDITNPTQVNFLTRVFVNGLFRETITGISTTVNGTGLADQLVARGLDLDGITFNNLPVVLDGSNLYTIRMDSVTFGSYLGSAVQLRVRHNPGADLTFNLMRFNTVPTSGLYLDAVDLDFGTFVLTINMNAATPSTGGQFVRTNTGAQNAVVRW